jgi:hypothetical protein
LPNGQNSPNLVTLTTLTITIFQGINVMIIIFFCDFCLFVAKIGVFLEIQSSWAKHFSDYSFVVHHPVKQDDWHLLAQSHGSFSQSNWFFITDQTPHPYLTRSLPAQF